MLQISEEPETIIKTFVKQWVRLLAEGRLEEACALLDEPNADGVRWTPESILAAVHETFSPDTRYFQFHPEGPVFTGPDELPAQRYEDEVGSFDDGSGYWYDYDLPLNHEWSDLTAQFEFYKRPEGLAVRLFDLHVM